MHLVHHKMKLVAVWPWVIFLLCVFLRLRSLSFPGHVSYDEKCLRQFEFVEKVLSICAIFICIAVFLLVSFQRIVTK